MPADPESQRTLRGELRFYRSSHRTDDDESYIPRVIRQRRKSEAELLDEAMGYIYYYDNVREHSALNYQTPFAYLKSQLPEIDHRIRFVIPIILDEVSVKWLHIQSRHSSSAWEIIGDSLAQWAHLLGDLPPM